MNLTFFMRFLQYLISIVIMMVPRLRASPRHGGAVMFLELLCSYPPRGRPFGGGGVHPSRRDPALYWCLFFHETLFNFMRITRFRASPGHGRTGRFPGFSVNDVVTDPPRGRPVGGGGVYPARGDPDLYWCVFFRETHFNFMMVTRLMASPRHGRAGRFPGFFQSTMLLLIRRGGVPSGAAAFIIHR